MYICHMYVSFHRGHMTVLDSWDLELQKDEGYPVRVLRTELRFSKRVANTFKLWAICSALLFDSLTTAILSVLRWKESQCNFNLLFWWLIILTIILNVYYLFLFLLFENCAQNHGLFKILVAIFLISILEFFYCLFTFFCLLYIISINILLIIKLGNIFPTFVIMCDPFLFS